MACNPEKTEVSFSSVTDGGRIRKSTLNCRRLTCRRTAFVSEPARASFWICRDLPDFREDSAPAAIARRYRAVGAHARRARRRPLPLLSLNSITVSFSSRHRSA